MESHTCHFDLAQLRRWPLFLLILCQSGALCAQERTGWTASLGAGLNLPVGRTSDFVHQTGTFTAAIGHQWKGRQALLAQYYATGLPFKGSPAEAQVNALEPRSSLYSVTGNYRRDVLGSAGLRLYVIAGAGWYRRVTTIGKPSLAGQIACSPWTGYWGYLCEGGFVPTEKVVAGATLDAIGFNVGSGVSGRIGSGERPRWFVEVRYHRAAHAGNPTETLPIVAGLTW